MPQVFVNCSYCQKQFLRSSSHIQESIKLGYKMYCSTPCQTKSKERKKVLICENPACAKKFKRQFVSVSLHNYCSSSCAAIINNKKYPKSSGVRKKCKICQKEFVSKEKYCSVTCKFKGQIVTSEEIVQEIRQFYQINGRIPLKKEFYHARAARERFGTWNNAITEAGFETNPVLFAKKWTSKDGHFCDSLAEKIIDDWLYSQKIIHERKVSYPGNSKFTADFLVKDYFIEFFGLFREHKRYDELRQQKLQLVNDYKLKFIAIYPEHLFPVNQLGSLFSTLKI